MKVCERRSGKRSTRASPISRKKKRCRCGCWRVYVPALLLLFVSTALIGWAIEPVRHKRPCCLLDVPRLREYWIYNISTETTPVPIAISTDACSDIISLPLVSHKASCSLMFEPSSSCQTNSESACWKCATSTKLVRL